MLRLLLLSALAVGLVLAHKGDDDDDHQRGLGDVFGDVASPVMVANGLRIISLAKKLERVKDKLKKAEQVDPKRFLDNLRVRVSELEGTHCSRRQFQCGGHEQECVSDILVCDGHKDCHNGHDEDKSVCDNIPIKSGHIFSGVSHWHDCLTRNDHVTSIVITQTKRKKFFPSRIWVRAHIESQLEDDDGHKVVSGFDAKGYYNFSNRRLNLIPANPHHEHRHLPVTCEFNYGDNERASCNRLLESSLQKCAHLDVHLEEHERN